MEAVNEENTKSSNKNNESLYGAPMTQAYF